MPSSKNFYKINNEKYDVNNFMALSLIGILVKLFFGSQISKDGLSGPATSTVWGLGIIGFSLIGMLLISVSLAIHAGSGSPKNIEPIIQDMLPVILMIIVIALIVGMNLSYYERINKGKVAEEYFKYANTSTIFVIVQLALVFNSLRQKFKYVGEIKDFKSIHPHDHLTGDQNVIDRINKLLNTHVSSISYIITLINFIMVGIMQIVLQFFTTDG